MANTRITVSVDKLVTFTDAARHLSVSRPTIYNLIRRLRLQPIKIGRNSYLMTQQLEQLKVNQQKGDARQ